MAEFLANLGVPEALIGTLVVLIGFAVEMLRKRLKRDEKRMNADEERLDQNEIEAAAQKSAMLAMLRDRIVQSYEHHAEKGSWTMHKRDALLDMAKQYAVLGGNGTVAHMVSALEKLPVETGQVG